jgi:alpha/beta superfamily hydrolase
MGDYISAYGFILKYSQLLAPGKQVELVLAGYSYGSMIASHQPNVEDVISIFSKPTSTSITARILVKAKKLIAGEEETEEEYYETEEVQLDDDTASDLPSAKISFLLVSPILSYALGFVTLWGNLSKLSVQGHNIVVTPAREERLPKFRSLIVYGTDDMFTSEKKLQNWGRKLKDVPESQVDVVEVRMAGHFWVEPSFHQKLRQAISDWLEHKQ